MKRLRRYQQIKKIASKVGKKGAKGMSFSHAQSQLSEASPGMEFSRDEITRKMSEEPLFSEEALDSILELTIEPHHAKMMNKAEKAFVEIGAFLTQKEDHIQEIGDYLSGENARPGWIKERYDISLQTLQGVIENFNQLDQAQRRAHEEAARKDAEVVSAAGKFGNGYETNEVVHDFGDGWKVVYVPAVGEGPDYRGNPYKSNDRTIEGNINGLCLGENQGLYQDNESGKIYSVRDSNNNPRVTIRIDYGELEEAKGKQNRSPDLEGAIHADEWFKTQEDSLNYRYSSDYKKFPPLTKDEAISKINKNPENAYKKGWVVSWFRRGVPEIDKDVFRRIKAKDILIVYSGLGKKYKELAQPVVRYWAEKWNNESSAEIWGDLDPYSDEQLSHESWKTYKKEPWMLAASEKLFMEQSDFAIEIGLQKIQEYKSIAEPAVESLAEKDPIGFFYRNLHETYPEQERTAAKSLAERYPNHFFDRKLYEAYPELGRIAAKSLVEEDSDGYFYTKLHELYPEEGRTAAKSLIENNPSRFFSYKLHETYPELGRAAAKYFAEAKPDKFFHSFIKLHETYPELERTAAKSLAEAKPDKFFSLDLHEAYPEEGRIAAKSLIKINPDGFFSLDLHEAYPELKLPAAESLAEAKPDRFFYRKLHETYPEEGRTAAEYLIKGDPNRFFFLKLHETYPELERTAAKFLAKINLHLFFSRELDKTYPEEGRAAAKSMAEADPYRFFYSKSYELFPELERIAAEFLAEKDPSLFFSRELHEAYPELGRTAAKSMMENNPNIFFSYQLHKTYPELTTSNSKPTGDDTVESKVSKLIHWLDKNGFKKESFEMQKVI